MTDALAFAKPNLIREEVSAHLRREILEGRIEAGHKLTELELAKQLGVSRTPIREALQRLSREGLVELLANRGARVRPLQQHEIEETYTVRQTLEGLAATLAATKRSTQDLERMRQTLQAIEQSAAQDYQTQIALDLEFHQAVADASANSVLIDTLRGLHQNIMRAKLLSRSTNQSSDTKREHRAIFRAIQNQDGAAAAQAAEAHVQRFKHLILQQLGAKHAKP